MAKKDILPEIMETVKVLVVGKYAIEWWNGEEYEDSRTKIVGIAESAENAKDLVARRIGGKRNIAKLGEWNESKDGVLSAVYSYGSFVEIFSIWQVTEENFRATLDLHR